MNKVLTFVLLVMISCSQKTEEKSKEILTAEEMVDSRVFDSTSLGLDKNSTFKNIAVAPNTVLLTGIEQVRLIPIYKVKPEQEKNLDIQVGTTYYNSYSETDEVIPYRYFMPGLDIIHGYGLVNIGHYNLQKQRLTYFFAKPVLVRTLYFPGDKNDSLNGKPIKRNFFMATVYDEDTNKDKLISKKDLRKMYAFDADNSNKITLLPKRFSAVRSTYDIHNDIMYVYARFDANNNGTPEAKEGLYVFYINLQNPTKAIRMY